MKRNQLLTSVSFFLLLFSAIFSEAQVSITSPTSGNELVPFPQDYAFDTLGNPWDMDSLSDLAQYVPAADYGVGLTPFTSFDFTGGLFSFEILTVNDAYFHMLSPGLLGFNYIGKNGESTPIDSTTYRFLNIRMFSETASTLRIHWNTGKNFSDEFVRTTTISTQTGWNTYSIDLETIAINSNSNETRGWSEAERITGLRIEPGTSGDIKVDWITLTATPTTGTTTVTHSFTPSGNDTLYSIFVDDNSDPFDGTHQAVLRQQSSTTTATVNIGRLFPGTYSVVGIASDDLATLNANPWDMNDETDITATTDLTGAAFSGGTFSFTTSSTSGSFFLNPFGENIDADTFDQFSMSFTSSVAGNGRVVWFQSGGASASETFAVSSGSNLVQIDLGSNGNWTGEIATFIVEIVDQSGASIALDFASLRANSLVSSLTNPTPATSPGSLIVNHPPILRITQPDEVGGEDFASAVLEDPWNMNSPEDFFVTSNLSSAAILPNNFQNGKQGDFFCATSEENAEGGDPTQTSLKVSRKSSDQIDADRYKNLTVEAYVNAVQDIAFGSSLRIIGGNEIRDGKNVFFNGNDTTIQKEENGMEWFTLTQDMTAIDLEELIHSPGDFPDPLWSGRFNRFRVDIHEYPDPTFYCINNISLRADDESNTQFAITFEVTDGNTSVDDLILSLFYTTEETATNGIAIVENLDLERDSRVFLWDTSAVGAGTYRVYGTLSDGTNSHTFLSHRIVIDHERDQDSTAPDLAIDSPSAGTEVFNNMRVTGYAIDDIQVATVEVLADGEYLGSITPALFNKEARTTFPSRADASQAGFDSLIDVSSLSNGSHSIEIKVYDTAGNTTSETISVTKSSGADPAFPTPTPVNEASITVPVKGSTKFNMKVKLNKRRGTLRITVNNANRCSTIDLYGHQTKSVLDGDFTATTKLKTFNIKKKNLVIRTKRRLKGLKADPDNGVNAVFVGLVCDGTFRTSKRLDVTNIVSRRKVKNITKYLKVLGRSIKGR